MKPEVLSEKIDGNKVYRVYSCPCGKGRIYERQDYTVGNGNTVVFIKCRECQVHYRVDF